MVLWDFFVDNCNFFLTTWDCLLKKAPKPAFSMSWLALLSCAGGYASDHAEHKLCTLTNLRISDDQLLKLKLGKNNNAWKKSLKDLIQKKKGNRQEISLNKNQEYTPQGKYMSHLAINQVEGQAP